MRDHTSNIRDVLAQATPTEIAAGQRWYDEAMELAETLSGRGNPEMGAGVIAALSPLTPWGRNKEMAIRAFADGHASGTLGNSIKAADRILGGEDPLDVLKSDKVRNFYLSIIGDTDAVCIDRHALEVYQGKRYRDSERPAIGKRLYREAATAYRDTARSLPYTATQLQAITWLVWRRIHLTGTRYEILL
jgi:hypothetical protein